ncbi:MAG: glycosyltransferase family 4 protein [Mycobacteriales bacterium]
MVNGVDGVDGATVCVVLGTSEGGVGAHVRVLAGRLVNRGADVVVCGPAATQQLFDFTSTGARFAAVPIARGFEPLSDRRAVGLVRAQIAGADVVHAHGLRAGYVAVRAARGRVPVVVTWHNALLGGGVKRRVQAWIERRIARGATLNLAVSSDLVARITSLGGRGVLAPVGATRLTGGAPSADGVRDQLGVGDERIVLAVGRLHPQKGFDILVDAAARLSGTALVLIAGDGPQRDELQQRIDSSGAPVRLLGRRDDVPQLLAAADVVVMPSRWEGSPLAAHEAMLAGRPLIAAAVGGLPDLAAGDAIHLVPSEDAAALAAAIEHLLGDPAYAAELAERGAARAREWPDGNASADAVIAAYAELLRR